MTPGPFALRVDDDGRLRSLLTTSSDMEQAEFHFDHAKRRMMVAFFAQSGQDGPFAVELDDLQDLHACIGRFLEEVGLGVPQ